MPQKRKDCGRGGHTRGGLSPPSPSPPKGPLTEHEISDERHAENSADEEGATSSNTTPSKDLLDGTTHRHPHTTRTPPNTSPTHPSQTPQHPSPSLYASGQTNCELRPRITPRKEEGGNQNKIPNETTIEKQQHQQHHQGLTPVFCILIVLLAIVGLYTLHQAYTKAEEEKLKRPPKMIAEIYTDLKSELQKLNREFSQPKEVWLGLIGQFEAVMVDEPQQPAIILLVVPDDSRGIATCLAHRLARAVQSAFEDSQFVMFDTRSSEYQDTSALLKLELDDTLKALSDSHAAVIHNVESIPGQAAMILHAYCDNENAPFKQSIIFLLAEVPGTYNELGYNRRLDSVVDDHLSRVWGADLAEKDVSALVSRTSNTAILVRPEKPDRVLEMCPL